MHVKRSILAAPAILLPRDALILPPSWDADRRKRFSRRNMMGKGYTHGGGGGSWHTLWSANLTSSVGAAGYEARVLASGLSHAANTIRLTVASGSGGNLILDHVSIATQASGANATATPVEVTFTTQGSGNPLHGVTITPANTQVVSDSVSFSVDTTSTFLLVADYNASTGGSSNPFANIGSDSLIKAGGSGDWNQQNVTGYSSSGGNTYTFVKMEGFY
jgi:hypothetical protein